MADNVVVTNPTPNSDYTVASDEVQVGGTNPIGEVQFVKLVDGTLNGTAPIPGSSSGLKVDLTSTGANATAIKTDGSAVTQPVSIAATISENQTQVAGTAIDVNSGLKSAGTQRVVIATDQPQLTNALKVDGSATTQPVSGTVSATISGAAQALDELGVLVSEQAHRYNNAPHLLIRNMQQERQLDTVIMLLQDVAMSLRQIAADSVSGRGPSSSATIDFFRGAY